MDLNLTFTFDHHFRIPNVAVGIDDVELYRGKVDTEFNFTVDLNDGPHRLWIEHYGKQLHETNNNNDCHVHIRQIKFDGVDLDQLDYCRLTHRGVFCPKYAESYIASCKESNVDLPEYISPNHYLGHNGVWHLDFSSPALLWIITEQNPSGMHLEDTMFSTSSGVLNEIKDFFKLQ